jgi:hypothetical protein
VPNLATYEALRSQVPRAHGTAYHHVTSPNTMIYMSFEITRRLEGVMPGKHIIVPDATIWSVLDTMWANYPNDAYVAVMSTIAYIAEHIRTEVQQERQNGQLDIWVNGKEGNWGLQRYDQLKMREKRPTPMIFSNQY